MVEREEEMEKTELEKRMQEEEEKIMKKCMEKNKTFWVTMTWQHTMSL